MGVVPWHRSRNTLVAGVLVGSLILVGLLVMPAGWSRMSSTGSYEQDESAQERPRAWYVAKQQAAEAGPFTPGRPCSITDSAFVGHAWPAPTGQTGG
jgi:hypothetical protein